MRRVHCSPGPARPFRFRCTKQHGAVRSRHGRSVVAPGAYRKDRGPVARESWREAAPCPPIAPPRPSVPAPPPRPPENKRGHGPRRPGSRAGRAHVNKGEALPTAARQGPAEDGGEAGAPLARQAATPHPSRHTHRRAVQPGKIGERHQHGHGGKREGALRKTANERAEGPGMGSTDERC